jgi:adenylate cyclase
VSDTTTGRAPRVLTFGDCELDLSARELRRNGRAQSLQPKVFELLAYLVDRRDRAVGKDELQNAVWPGVLVSEASLTQAIRKARRAIGDNEAHAPMIRTVHGHGYRFCAPIAPAPLDARANPEPQAVSTGAAADWRPRIAVLPFANQSADPQQEYFSDAITQDLISRLSRHRWLDVLARNATFGYRDRAASVDQLTRELGADYVVTGSVRRSGERIRVSAELIRADTGSQLWAEHYDRDAGEVFALQDELTNVLVARLEPAIGSSERRRVMQNPPRNLDAWHCYHLGVWHFFRFTAADNAKAQQLFQRARDLDPLMGEAHAWWAYATVLGMVYWDVDATDTLLTQALDATSRALQLDDQNAVFYALRARVRIARREYESAHAENELAIALNQSLAAAYCGLGDTLAYMNRCEDAIEQFEHAIALSPNDPQRWAFLTYGALAFLFKGDFEAALAWTDRALVIPNRQYWTPAHRTAALAGLDRTDEARAAARALLAEKPDFTCAFARRKLFYVRDTAQLDRYVELLMAAGVPPG